MADALCGPSNALQNFQKHTAVDRTLQQDRIVNRVQSPQNFRSQPRNAAFLDHEFESFENDFSQNSIPQMRHGGLVLGAGAHSQHVHAQPFHTSPVVGGGDWAADFQKLAVSGPSLSPQQGHAAHPPNLNTATMNGWQNEFMQRQQPQAHPASQSHFHQPTFQPSFMSSYQNVNGMPLAVPMEQALTQSTSAAPAAFDESAFEAAFNQAQTDMREQEAILFEQHQISEDMQSEEPASVLEAEYIQIGSDLIGNTEDSTTKDPQTEQDELARTAGHLLDSVGHDTSQKFKESNFLALMRRIRDREVQIEGDEFREVQQALHPGGEDYPGKSRSVGNSKSSDGAFDIVSE